MLTSSESEDSDGEPSPVQHTSSRPQRGAKSKAISYREIDVNEKEVARWDNVDVENKVKTTTRRAEHRKAESAEKKRPLSRISETKDNSRKTSLEDANSNLKKFKSLPLAPKGQRSVQTFLSDFAPSQSQSSEAMSAATSTQTSTSVESDRRTSTRRS